MQWLVSLETENDPIPACRVLNIFRRKGVKVLTLTLALEAGGYSLLALVETAESEVDHIFNFLRRTEGVQHVTCYRHEPAEEAGFVFVDSGADTATVGRLLASVPGARLAFASQGKALIELPAGNREPARGLAAVGTPFARVRTTRPAPAAVLTAAS